MASGNNDSRITVIVAVLSLVGVLGAALIANSDKLFQSKTNTANTNVAAANVTNNTLTTPPPDNSMLPNSNSPDNRSVIISVDGNTGSTESNSSKAKKPKKTKDPGIKIVINGSVTVTVEGGPVKVLVQQGSSNALKKRVDFSTKATVIIDGKKYTGETDPEGDPGSGIFTFPPIPCNKEITIIVHYIERGDIERKKFIDCKKPTAKIPLDLPDEW